MCSSPSTSPADCSSIIIRLSTTEQFQNIRRLKMLVSISRSQWIRWKFISVLEFWRQTHMVLLPPLLLFWAEYWWEGSQRVWASSHFGRRQDLCQESWRHLQTQIWWLYNGQQEDDEKETLNSSVVVFIFSHGFVFLTKDLLWIFSQSMFLTHRYYLFS